MFKGYFVWSIPFLFFACNSGTVSTSTDPENSEWYVAYNEKETENGKRRLDVYALRFYPDSSYTLCADLLFEQGSWYYDDERKLLVLHPGNPGSEVKERYIVDKKKVNNKTVFSFYHQYPPATDNIDEEVEMLPITNQSVYDPYSKAMSTWRKKPSAAESPDQIKKRTVAYLLFLQSLYHHAKDNHLENAGGRWYPQPVKFFSNKVSMAYADELNDWNNCFFNDEQAVEAYKLISGALMKIKIEGKDDVNRNINCVEQLMNEINK